jgi:hypothetical protein
MIIAVKDLSLTRVGAVCAILTTASFVLGIVLMASSGVQVLIPDTGKDAFDWIADVDDAGGLFTAGAWLVILGGLFGIVALVGFYDALRAAGPVLIFVPILGAIGMTLVTISHLMPIAMAYELVPGYTDANAATQASLGVTAETLAATALVLNYTGDALLWGVVVPLVAFAGLRAALVPQWIGWLGIFTAAVAGWLGLLSPASDVIDGITFVGFVGFFVWIASMGVALLRRREPAAEELAPAAIH